MARRMKDNRIESDCKCIDLITWSVCRLADVNFIVNLSLCARYLSFRKFSSIASLLATSISLFTFDAFIFYE